MLSLGATEGIVPPNVAGAIALLIFLLAGLGLVAMKAIRDPQGWQVRVLHWGFRAMGSLAFRQSVRRRCPLPVEGPAIVIANHHSPTDPIFIYSPSEYKRGGQRLRIIEFMTAREYVEVGGIVSWICRTAHCIPVKRDGRDTGPAKDALRRLKDGRLIGVFPEGRINVGEGLLPANPGIAWLALRSEVPVYPVFIHGAPFGKNMVEPFFKFCKVSATWGDPIDLSAYYGQRKSPELLDEVASLLMERLAALGGVRANDPQARTASDE